jgi:FlaA1/EpsC-like NDP-sugar epimerase
LRSVQILIFAVSGFAAFLLRFDLVIPHNYVKYLEFGIPIWIVVKAIVFWLGHLDSRGWRSVSIYDLQRIFLVNLLASCGSAALILWTAPQGFPRSIYLLDFVMCFLATAGIRISARLLFDFVLAQRQTHPGKPVLIYGAGMAGLMLLRELRSNPKLLYTALGFIDDNPEKRGTVFHGLRVLGNGSGLGSLVAKLQIGEVLIALPSATGAEMSTILRQCQDAKVRCRTIPALADIIENRGLASQIRDVDVEDLLGRQPVRLEQNLISAKVCGRVVLISGAAGSIGSELCRQIARFHPCAIVALDFAETALFSLEREIRSCFPEVQFSVEIGNIQNGSRVYDVIKKHKPSIVYHAAAYKHVPMMEVNVVEAVENNVFGTYSLALAAAELGVADFVMISSDKAVRPANIMGATKRVAELLIKAQIGKTKFVSVRFGNVLGSNGSVVPIFKQQIAAGGPVCVTHPEMRRYFMTIPEAAQLVLQAATMGKGGEIFVLDMGEPVKIVDLAENLILLSGLRPRVDIQIEFSGLRPGEKLYEELMADQEATAPTYHDKINVFTGAGHVSEKMMHHLDVLRELCAIRDQRGIVLELKEIVPDFNPSADILRRIVEDQPRFSHSTAG